MIRATHNTNIDRIYQMVNRLVFMLLCVVCCLSVSDVFALNRTYTNSSILADGKIVKVRVSKEGIYQYTASQLKSMGFNDINKVSIYGYGGELLSEDYNKAEYKDDLPEIPTILNGDKLVFYLKGTIGVRSYYDADYVPSVLSSIQKYATFVHTENYTSDYAYYFLKENDSPKRIETKPLDETPMLSGYDTTFTYRDFKLYKYDEYNLCISGRNWIGCQMTPNETINFDTDSDNLVPGDSALVYARLVSKCSDVSSFKVETNKGTQSKTLSKSSGYVFGRECAIGISVSQNTGEKPSLKVKFEANVASARGYVDYVVLLPLRYLAFDKTSDKGVRLFSLYQNHKNRLQLACVRTTDSPLVWDVTDINDIQGLETIKEDTKMYVKYPNVTLNKGKRYAIVDPNSKFDSPETVGEVANQNLHALKDIEYIIISHEDFLTAANRLATLHKEKEGYSYIVTTPEQVFNEFSSGTPDPTAFRSFARMLYDKAKDKEYSVAPKFMLLVGDGLYDNKNNGKNSLNDRYAKIITYQSVNSLDETSSYTSDDYFGILSSSSCGYGSTPAGEQTIAVGRIPCSTLESALAYVDKVERYMADEEKGWWKCKYLIAADDNNEYDTYSNYHTFVKYGEELSEILFSYDPSLNTEKIYWDAYAREVSGGSNRYPGVMTDIERQLLNGTLIFNYIGHSSFNSMSSEYVFSLSQSQTIGNTKYPLWYSASCNLSQWDDYQSSIGENLVMNPNGGSIVTIASSRTAYTLQNQYFNKNFVNELFDVETNDYVIGTMYKSARTMRGNDSNKMTFCLLGDPAIKLAIPQYNVVTDSVKIARNGEYVPTDTLHALDRVLLSGSIRDENGDVMTDFNGIVEIVLKDKSMTVKTRGNNTGVDGYEYQDYLSTLYAGRAKVINGKFIAPAILPKDINYSYGYSRINYYAYNDISNGGMNMDAKGSSLDIVVGGLNPNTEETLDTEGPDIKISLGNENIGNNCTVGDNPLLIVHISDFSGINSSGAGIGHDITMTMDNNREKENINSMFSYDEGSCTNGSLQFHLGNLSEGWHTLTIKAWDLVGNSNEETIKFFVNYTSKLNVVDVLTYPVPATEVLNQKVITDRPNEVLEYQVKVYTLDGAMVKTEEGQKSSSSGEIHWTWNLTADNGAPLQNGQYIVVMKIKTKNGEWNEIVTRAVIAKN